MSDKLWIKTPFPGETVNDGVWHECTTWYEKNRLFPKHHSENYRKLHQIKLKTPLPTHVGDNPPEQ